MTGALEGILSEVGTGSEARETAEASDWPMAFNVRLPRISQDGSLHVHLLQSRGDCERGASRLQVLLCDRSLELNVVV